MNELNNNVRGRAVGYIGAALGLVAGLAWNEAITALINALFPLAKDTVLVKFGYAIVLTVVIVIAIGQLEKFTTKENNSTPQ